MRFELTPIGVIRSAYTDKYRAPRQPGVFDADVSATIELFPGQNFEQALQDLDGIEQIWILSWFDRATTWSPKVLPPRSDRKRGVFATRAPHRPNPIGLSVARIVRIHGREIEIACDVLRLEFPDRSGGQRGGHAEPFSNEIRARYPDVSEPHE